MLHRRALLMSCISATSALSGNALAQAYPDRPIKLIVPFAPEGATDILGRLTATTLTYLTALIGGQVQVAVDTVVASTPFVKSGKIKAIAVLSPTRSSLLPDVPTVAESSYPGIDISTWIALHGTRQSASLPAPIRMKLEAALASVMAGPKPRKKLNDLGLIPAYAPSGSVKARIEKDLTFMRAVAARIGIKAE